MKSTNVRQLMNILSQKYFGNQPNYTSNKLQRPTVKIYAKNQQINYSILSPVTSNKTSPKFSRLSYSQGKPIDHQAKPNENFNYFQQTKNYFQQTKAKLKNPHETILKTNQRKKLQLKDTNGTYAIPYLNPDESSSQMDQSESGVFVSSYSRKCSEKDLMRNNSGSYLNPVTFSNISPCQNVKNTNPRLVKEQIIESKGVPKKLFLKENTSSVHKLQSNSTVSNSRASMNIKKESVERENMMKRREEEERIKDELQFYKSKCMKLQQQNLQLKEKVSTYEQQFAETQLLVQNLKNMISRREQEIDEIIGKRLGGYEKKQRLLQIMRGENESLRNELQEVRQVLRQQESIIMELYGQHKERPVTQEKQRQKEQRTKSVSKANPYSSIYSTSTNNNNNNGNKIFISKNNGNGSKNIGSSSLLNSNNTHSRAYVSSYIDSSNYPRQSIAQTTYEDDQFRIE